MSDDLLPKDWRGEPVQRPLLEDLADVLSRTVVGWKDVTGIDLSEHPDVQRVMARFRIEREQALRTMAWGLEVEIDCIAFGNSLHSRINGEIQRTDPAGYMITHREWSKIPQEEVERVRTEQKPRYMVTYQCRKCGHPIDPGQFRFGSPETGWEHMEGECVGLPQTM